MDVLGIMINDIYSNSCWIMSSNKENFKYAIEIYNRTWGVQDKWFPQWKALERENIIFFYISDNVKKIIGCGKIENKFIQREPLWPDEIRENKVKYPLRFTFKVDFLLSENEWNNRGIDIIKFMKENWGRGKFAELLRGGVNFIQHKELINFLIREFNKKLSYEILFDKIPIQYEEEVIEEQDLHKQLIELIVQIGNMNNLLSQKEYKIDNMILDVVWRRIEKGSPTYVFEVQVGGDVYHALSKLKHAFDLWNSNVFLIIHSKRDVIKADQLLGGTFHEIKERVKIINSKDIRELYKRKKSWVEFEKKLGIL